MPCNDWPDGRVVYVEDDKSKKALATVEAMLCAVLTVAKKHKTDLNFISQIDEKESGVSVAKLTNWWVDHQEKDRLRHRREALQKQKLLLKEVALKKLTPEERKALGL